MADTRIHPQLDPRKFDHALSGYEEADRDHAVVRARRARQALADGMGRIIAARDALSADGTRTPAEQARQLSETSQTVQRRAVAEASEGEKALRQRAKRADDEIDAALRVVAPQEASEVRAYLKSLPSAGARIDFLRQVIRSGDTATAAAVLTARPFLSGLDQKAAAMVRQEAERQVASDSAIVRDAALKAADEMGQAVRAFYGQITKVVDENQAAKAVEQRQRSEQAIKAATGLEPLDDGQGADDGDDNADAA